MTTATLSKWGTGQGVHVSKKVMEKARVKLGDSCEVTTAPGIITLDFTKGAHRDVRREPVTFEEVFDGWSGSRKSVSDPWASAGNVGAEKELWG